MRTITATCLALALSSTLVSQNYTMEIPSEFGSEWSLCSFDIIALGNIHNAGGGMATMQQEFEGIHTLSGHGFTVTWSKAPGGGGTIEVETEYRNVFYGKMGLCYWTANREERFFEFVMSDLVGGSDTEQELAGPYHGHIEVLVDLCGQEFDLSEVEAIQGIIDDAIADDQNAICHFREFDTYDAEERMEARFRIAHYERSHRNFTQHVLDELQPHQDLYVWHGNRLLTFGNCKEPGLWYSVLEDDSLGTEEWGEAYTGYRVYATHGDDGNVFIGWGAAINTAMINIVGTPDTGKLTIGSAPVPGDNSWGAANFVTATRGEGMQITEMVRSVSGTLWIRDGLENGTKSGTFEAVCMDHLGRTRTLIGGFRNVALD